MIIITYIQDNSAAELVDIDQNLIKIFDIIFNYKINKYNLF